MPNNRTFFTRAYSKWSLFQLFLLCAFPIHLWALLMGFRDFSWMALRTNVWDALGLMAYALSLALAESIAIFLLVALLGLLIPDPIDKEKRLALVGVAFLVVALWAVVGQIYSGTGYPMPAWLAEFLIRTEHPFRYTWLLVFLLAAVTAAVPLLLIVRRKKFKNRILDLFDRISTVSFLYLFFDLIGIVIIVIRNLHI